MNGKKNIVIDVQTNKDLLNNNLNCEQKPPRSTASHNTSKFSTPRSGRIRVSRMRNGSLDSSMHSSCRGLYSSNYRRWSEGLGGVEKDISKLKNASKKELSKHMAYEKDITAITARINKLNFEECKTKNELLWQQKLAKRDNRISQDKKERHASYEKYKKDVKKTEKEKLRNSRKMKTEMENKLNKVRERNKSVKSNNAKMATMERKKLEKMMEEERMKELSQKKKNCQMVKDYFFNSNEKMRKYELRKRQQYKRNLEKELETQSKFNKKLEEKIQEQQEVKNKIEKKINKLNNSVDEK
ncbi:MAG: hypothetical protein MJ252_20190 [archaeon]|nr:hypothetical protein [archaeon]